VAGRRVGSSVLRGRGPGARRRGRRNYARDSRGRFAATGASSGGSSEDDEKRRTRRRTAAGVTVAVGAVAASQARPASRTRTTVQRHRVVKTHVGRARADHANLTRIRARAFPTTAVTGKPFDAKAARAEARRLTKGYGKRVRTVRKRSRKSS
jgi:hypothetical protein